MAPLLVLASMVSSAAAPASDVRAVEALPADHLWARTHRYYLETQVDLPNILWLATPYNHQARATAFDLRLVTRCSDGALESKRVVQIHCTLEDVALSARGLPQEAGLLGPILAELDDELTGSVVQLQLHEDGHLVNIDLENAIDRRNRRIGRINETLRLIVSRAFAGLDLARGGDEEVWVRYSSWLLRAPSAAGSTGGAEVVNRAVERSGAFVRIQSAGRGLIVPSDGLDKFDARLVAEAWVDGAGKITDRTWTVVAAPTASAFIAEGTEGYPYIQRGRLVALAEGDEWSVGESRELPPSTGPSALQLYDAGGLTPGL